jgi:hypothetical protein
MTVSGIGLPIGRIDCTYAASRSLTMRWRSWRSGAAILFGLLVPRDKWSI